MAILALHPTFSYLAVAIVLTPVFNGMSARQAPYDETVAADYYI